MSGTHDPACQPLVCDTLMVHMDECITLTIAALECIMCGKKAHDLVFHSIRFSAHGIDDMMAVRLMFAEAAKQMTAPAT
jgi:hypothetical protein